MSTMGQDFANIYGRELDRLAEEVAAYENDSDLWSTSGGQKNPPGNLALHTAGTLMHFIGGGLGASGYVRDRDREFSEHDVPRAEIVRRIRECRDTVVPVLAGLEDAAMGGAHPGDVPARFHDASLPVAPSVARRMASGAHLLPSPRARRYRISLAVSPRTT